MDQRGWLLGVIIAGASAVASAGPFGLNEGDTLEAVSKFAKLTPMETAGVYRTERLPNGHPDIHDYRLVFGPTTGLCRINAVGPTRPTNSFGEQVRTEFTEWQAALASKYGAPEKLDFLDSGSIWNEPRDWSMALAKKERTLAAVWKLDRAPVDGLSVVRLEAHAFTSANYAIRLVYEFSNFDACKASLLSKRNANL